MSTEFLPINANSPSSTLADQISALIAAGKQPLFALPTSMRDQFLLVVDDGLHTNRAVEVLESLARTATLNSELLTNAFGKGLIVLVDVTAVTGTPSVVVKVQGEINGVFYDLLTSVAITATGQTVLHVYPAITEVANTKVAAPVPRNWRVRVEHGNADSITYSINACVLL